MKKLSEMTDEEKAEVVNWFDELLLPIFHEVELGILAIGEAIEEGFLEIFNWLVPFTQIVLEEAEDQGFFLGDPVT